VVAARAALVGGGMMPLMRYLINEVGELYLIVDLEVLGVRVGREYWLVWDGREVRW
jgi:hypothetical protein